MKQIIVIYLLLLTTFHSFGQNKDWTKRILFVLTNNSKLGNTGKHTGYTMSEAARPWKVFSDFGYEVDFASPSGGCPPIHSFGMKDPDILAFQTNEVVQMKLQNTLRPDQIDWKRYDAIYYVGGHGTMWDFPNNKILQKITATMYEQGKIVSALCHGVVAIANTKLSNGKFLIEGKRISAFSNNEEKEAKLDSIMPFLPENKIKENGGIYIPASNWAYNVVSDGNIVTGQNPESAKGIAQEIIRIIEKQKILTMTTNEYDIIKTMESWGKAYIDRDYITLEKLIHSDWKFQGGGTSIRIGKMEAIEGFKNSKTEYLEILIANYDIKIEGDIAYLTADEELKLKEQDGTISRQRNLVTDIFIKENGFWRGILTHKSRR
jgi:putative intracellular protease/amidase/ketosteroid isomerase-like protein